MQVETYRVALFHRTVNYGSAGRCFTIAHITCHGSEASEKATLVFYDPTQTITVPLPQGHDPTLVFLPRDQFAMHLDLLRNEGPIHLVTDHSRWNFGSLRTSTEEPVGEGE